MGGFPHLQHLNVKDQRLGVLLQRVQVGVAQGSVFMHLGHAAAVSLALHRVLACSDVPKTLGHERVQDHVLQEGHGDTEG